MVWCSLAYPPTCTPDGHRPLTGLMPCTIILPDTWILSHSTLTDSSWCWWEEKTVHTNFRTITIRIQNKSNNRHFFELIMQLWFVSCGTTQINPQARPTSSWGVAHSLTWVFGRSASTCYPHLLRLSGSNLLPLRRTSGCSSPRAPFRAEDSLIW